MWNEEDERNNNQNDDLSDMINAYSKDNELRKKINELKKQKEETVKTEEEPFSFASYTKEETQPISKASGIPDIQVDDDLTKTRVGFSGEEAYDKTLVIMNSKPKASFSSEELEEEIVDEDYEEEELDEDRTIETTTQAFASMDDDDDDEEEEDEDPFDRKSRKKEPDPKADQKMNKIITYVIIGVVAVVVLVAGGFGVKFALDHFLSDEPKVEETDKDKDNNTTKDPDKDNNVTNKTDGSDDTDLKDNSAAKAKINGELKALESQLEDKKKEVSAAQSALDEANQNKTDYTNHISSLSSDAQAAVNNQTLAEKAFNDAKKAYDDAVAASSDETTLASLKTTMDQAQADMTAKQQDASTKTTALEKENKEYPTKMKELDQAVTSAQNTLSDLKKEQAELEKQVADKTTELNDLE